MTDYVKMVDQYGIGTLYTYRNSACIVPDDVENQKLWARRAWEAIEYDDAPEGIVKIRNGTNRSAEERGELWGLLNDRVDKYDPLEFDDLGATLASDVRVPMRVVAEGKAAMAAYLAAFDHSNSSISNALDVGERTVSQYISDFKKGER